MAESRSRADGEPLEWLFGRCLAREDEDEFYSSGRQRLDDDGEGGDTTS